MNSAGNDIVALTAIDVDRTRRPKFYSRIISPAEQEFYSAQLSKLIPFEHFVWLAWSVKESAYKFLKRFDPELIFSPTKMAMDGLNFSGECFEGTVRSGDHVLFSKSFIRQDYIFSITNGEEDLSDIHCAIKKIGSSKPDDQSRAVRELLLRKLGHIFPESNLQIIKNPHGWPVIMREDEKLPIPVSFTHHGNFVAYTFQLSSASWKAHEEIL